METVVPVLFNAVSTHHLGTLSHTKNVANGTEQLNL